MHSNKKADPAGEAIRWIRDNLDLKQSSPVEFIYDQTESQSGRSLAVIYQPFDPTKRGHFVDRGQILDFALHAGGGRVLDFGPGDGWPSLLIAPMVEQIVGVDGSKRRTEICTQNAERLGVTNVDFVHVEPGKPLPFEDESFDAVVAASSIEQTPDPKATLTELYRVLRCGGRVRLDYESLGRYRDGRERELGGLWIDQERARLIVFDRHPDEELVHHIGLATNLSDDGVRTLFAEYAQEVSMGGLTPDVLEELAPHVVEAAQWTTQHPSCATWLAWIKGTGFRKVRATYDGGWFAGCLFDHLTPSETPRDIEAVDAYFRPLVEVIITMEAPQSVPPGQWEHSISAEK